MSAFELFTPNFSYLAQSLSLDLNSALTHLFQAQSNSRMARVNVNFLSTAANFVYPLLILAMVGLFVHPTIWLVFKLTGLNEKVALHNQRTMAESEYEDNFKVRVAAGIAGFLMARFYVTLFLETLLFTQLCAVNELIRFSGDILTDKLSMLTTGVFLMLMGLAIIAIGVYLV